MRTSHELLLKYRFDHRFEISEARVWYVDRGAQGDMSVLDGDQIISLESDYMEIRSGERIKRIPYHRIRKILYAGDVVWPR